MNIKSARMRTVVRKMNKKLTVLALLALLVSGALASMTNVVSAASVEPTHIAGASNENKTCAVVMPGTTELKVEADDGLAGTKSDGTLTVEIVVPSIEGTPNSFDWSSNINVLGVIVKDGVDGANWYDYSPDGRTDDTNLQTPFNGARAISHISFCYRPALEVAKDAHTTFTRTFEWDIEKSVTPETWDLFTGDNGTSEYTVEVTKTGFIDSDWAVSGMITVTNPAPEDATINGVSDVVSPDIVATVECGVGFPYTLPADQTLTCTYSADLPDGVDRVNTATATLQNHDYDSAGAGTPSGTTDFSGSADVDFSNATLEVINDSINVEDTFAGDLGTFGDSGSAAYTRTFACDDDEGTHENTATIVETGQSDDASVTVNCYALEVAKDAHTSLTRTWEWTIEKSADETELDLAEGQLFEVNYEVTVDASFVDSDYVVTGTISIDNPNPVLEAALTEVSDLVSPDIGATVDCPSLTVPADGSLECTYSAALPDDTTRTNTATATLQNHDHDSEGAGTPSGTTDFSGSADVDFSNPTVDEFDECVDVSDDNIGLLGEVCSGDAPATFNYSLVFGTPDDVDVQLECGDNTHNNIASFVTNDTSATGEDDETVNAHVDCVEGCTLTPGYWKTHSDKGPAPFDDTWDLLPNGSDTIFFLSGQTYYEVLWTAPQGGNAYYILAHAYIAAELNQLNGADFTDAEAAFDEATELFETYTPEEIGAIKGNQPPRPKFISLAQTLDDYNNGLIGPGHCSEDDTSATGFVTDRPQQVFSIFLPVVERN